MLGTGGESQGKVAEGQESARRMRCNISRIITFLECGKAVLFAL
jgi:hypothetical protein